MSEADARALLVAIKETHDATETMFTKVVSQFSELEKRIARLEAIHGLNPLG